MERTLDAKDVRVGFHPDGYRIDRAASAMNRYTKWQTKPGDRWRDPEPVCFDSLPQQGWFVVDRFDWDKISNTEDYA